jgi:coproporphyrinogen III oxidase-like Fe-S oxidoreductase
MERKKQKYLAYVALTFIGIGAGAVSLGSFMEKSIQEKEKLEKMINETQTDSIPQVTNYEYVGPLIPIWKDPIRNVYDPEK